MPRPRHTSPKGYHDNNPRGGNSLTDVPHPAGATQVHEWYDPDRPRGVVPTTVGPDLCRYFRGSSWLIARDDRDTGMCLKVGGRQWADGRVERLVMLDDDNLAVKQARQLAAALVAAADECEQMGTYDQMVVS